MTNRELLALMSAIIHSGKSGILNGTDQVRSVKEAMGLLYQVANNPDVEMDLNEIGVLDG